MADVTIPPSTPCQFHVGWVGKCKKPSTNGWCSEHEKLMCVVCGNKATKDCERTMGPMVCGAPLCDTCVHSPINDGPSHVTKDGAQKIEARLKKEKLEKVASRTNPLQRKDESGNPLNLLELLKDPAMFTLTKLVGVELRHGLMGFFPAIITQTKGMVIVTDKVLLADVWKLLEPLDSKLWEVVGYVGNGVAYLGNETNVKSEEERERYTPHPLLTREKFDQLISESSGCPFCWAPGLFGGNNWSKEDFHRMIANSLK